MTGRQVTAMRPTDAEREHDPLGREAPSGRRYRRLYDRARRTTQTLCESEPHAAATAMDHLVTYPPTAPMSAAWVRVLCWAALLQATAAMPCDAPATRQETRGT